MIFYDDGTAAGDDERIDDIGFGNLKLIQKPKDFCYGVDAVILADFAANNAKTFPRVIADLGTGTGVIPLILSYKTGASEIYGVEVQRDSYERAVRNAKLNLLEDRLTFINGDVKDKFCWGANLKEAADMVVSNPPYFKSGGGIVNDKSAKAVARHETTAGLEDFMECAAYLLKPKGDFFMVHRPSRLVDVCCFGRAAGLEPKEIRFVSPTEGGIPNIMLIHMVKGGGSELRFMTPLAVYDGEGNYTEELLKAYNR